VRQSALAYDFGMTSKSSRFERGAIIGIVVVAIVGGIFGALLWSPHGTAGIIGGATIGALGALFLCLNGMSILLILVLEFLQWTAAFCRKKLGK